MSSTGIKGRNGIFSLYDHHGNYMGNVCTDAGTVRIGSTTYMVEKTCHKVPGRMKYGRRMPACSECGQSLGDARWNYCPKCGARIVETDDD